jgi:hypothetical protein
VACLSVVTFLLWAPGVVSDSPGVPTRAWYENLRHDVGIVTNEQGVPRIVDSETPRYVMPEWMATDNRVSTILELAHAPVVYNVLDGKVYLVRGDGHLGEAVFRRRTALVADVTLGPYVRLVQPSAGGSNHSVCVGGGARLLYRPGVEVRGQRLALRIFYSDQTRGSGRLVVEADDPDRPFRYLSVRQFGGDAELIDLGTPRMRGMTLFPSPGDDLCIERMEIGSLTAGGD